MFKTYSLKVGKTQTRQEKNSTKHLQARQTGFLYSLHPYHCTDKMYVKRKTFWMLTYLCSYTELPFQVFETHKLDCISVWSLLISWAMARFSKVTQQLAFRACCQHLQRAQHLLWCLHWSCTVLKNSVINWVLSGGLESAAGAASESLCPVLWQEVAFKFRSRVFPGQKFLWTLVLSCQCLFAWYAIYEAWDNINPINIYFIRRSGLFSIHTFTYAIWLKKGSCTQLFSVKATALFQNLRGKQQHQYQFWGIKRHPTFSTVYLIFIFFFSLCSLSISRLEGIFQTFKSLCSPILRNISHSFNYGISLRGQESSILY